MTAARRSVRATAWLLAAISLIAAPRGSAERGTSAAAASAPGSGALYDAGTEALARGDLGAAVTMLKAASRIEPRARDIQANLSLARSRAAARAGEGERGEEPAPRPFPISSAESWWLAAAVLCLASISGAFGLRLRSRAWLVSAPVLLVAVALGLAGVQAARFLEESRRPEAVVVVPILAAGPAPDERPRPPYLLGEGDEVRMGAARGPLVEVWIGGNPIGWAARTGLWRVIDAPRYTARPGP
jgi:hypothetical protein